jgi:hypothetical protein
MNHDDDLWIKYIDRRNMNYNKIIIIFIYLNNIIMIKIHQNDHYTSFCKDSRSIAMTCIFFRCGHKNFLFSVIYMWWTFPLFLSILLSFMLSYGFFFRCLSSVEFFSYGFSSTYHRPIYSFTFVVWTHIYIEWYIYTYSRIEISQVFINKSCFITEIVYTTFAGFYIQYSNIFKRNNIKRCFWIQLVNLKINQYMMTSV